MRLRLSVGARGRDLLGSKESFYIYIYINVFVFSSFII